VHTIQIMGNGIPLGGSDFLRQMLQQQLREAQQKRNLEEWFQAVEKFSEEWRIYKRMIEQYSQDAQALKAAGILNRSSSWQRNCAPN